MQAILRATLEELTRTGYGALRVEEVAAIAGVNKTTVYRRWPTKAELVRDALLTIPERVGAPPESGSLRADLLAMAHQMVQTLSSLEGEGVVRMLLVERTNPELARIADSIRQKKQQVLLRILEKAVVRGELPAHVDPQFILTVLVGVVHHETFIMRTAPDRAFLERLVDFALAGANHMPCAREAKRVSGPSGTASGKPNGRGAAGKSKRSPSSDR